MQRPLRILYITPILFGKTIFAHARINLAREFARRGFSFRFIAPFSSSAAETLTENNLDFQLFSWRDFPGLSTLSKSGELLVL